MRNPVRRLAVLTACGLSLGACTSLAAESPELTRDDLKVFFDRRGVTGAFVLQDLSTGARTIYNPSLARERVTPASTFKIPNTLIALETGVARLDTVLPWDGVVRTFPEHNRDHDLASAFRSSAVWYYQELARRIGARRMQDHLDRFEYGNRDRGGSVDDFWLAKTLLICPVEQALFLEKVYLNRLGLRAENVEALKSMMLLEEWDGIKLYGKTGAATDLEPALGWLVGFVEDDGRAYCYAMLLRREKPDAEFFAMRKAIVRDIVEYLLRRPRPT